MVRTVNKKKIIEQVANKSGLDIQQAGEIVAAVLDIITEQVSQGETINIAGFGSFSICNRQARHGSHPRTHQPMEIPASKLPVFHASPLFKDKLN